MPLVLIDEDYNGLPSLYANAGDWVPCQVRFFSRFDYESSEFEKLTYRRIAGNQWLELPVGQTWDDKGFAVGDDIDITTTWHYNNGAPPTFSCAQAWNRQITYIDGNKLHIDAHLVASPCGGAPPSEVADGREFPTDSIVNRFDELLIVKTTAAEEIEFQFNLTQNGSTSLNSVIDGELIRLSSDQVAGMLVTDTINLTQLGDKSGGYIKDVQLTYDSIDGSNYRAYTLNYKILQWGFIQDGFTEPNYYLNTDHLAPIVKIKLFGQTGDPNTVQEVTNTNPQADTGGFNENYNGGPNLYSLTSIDWLDHLGDPIDAMDYSNPCTFEAIINAPGQSINNSTFRIGLVFRPLDETLYQSRPNTLANNLLVNAPDQDYQHNPVPDPTVWPGFINDDGVQLDLSDLEFFINGANVRVRGKVTPNAAAQAFFDDIPDGGRNVALWVSIGDYLVDGTDSSKRVNLTIHNEDIIDAPTLGVQIPNMIGTIMLDHAGLNSLGPDPRFESTITTEDDVLYEASLRLVDNVNYESMGLELQAFNATTGDVFTLESFNFDFDGVVQVAGQFQPNFNIGRGFNLPPTTDRNHVSLTREPAFDVPGQYGIKVCYGFLSRWEYWLAQLGVSPVFYDVAEPNDGFNKDWERYADTTDWSMRVKLTTLVDGVEDFDYHIFDIRPYEDEDCDTVVTITRVSDGAVLTAFEDDELHDVTAVITWNAGNFSEPWAAATIEDFEGGNRWLISSVLDHGFAANPLEPIPGFTKLSLSVSPINVATLKFRVDTNKVSASQVSLTYRIHDPSSPIEFKLTTDDVLKITADGQNKIKA